MAGLALLAGCIFLFIYVEPVWYGVACLAGGLACCVWSFVTLRESKLPFEPVATFTGTGIVSPALPRELPWSDIEDYGIVTNNQDGYGYCQINLTLKEGAPGFKSTFINGVSAVFTERRRQLELKLERLKDAERNRILPKTVSEELCARLNAAIARAAIEERKKMREKS